MIFVRIITYGFRLAVTPAAVAWIEREHLVAMHVFVFCEDFGLVPPKAWRHVVVLEQVADVNKIIPLTLFVWQKTLRLPVHLDCSCVYCAFPLLNEWLVLIDHKETG